MENILGLYPAGPQGLFPGVVAGTGTWSGYLTRNLMDGFPCIVYHGEFPGVSPEGVHKEGLPGRGHVEEFPFVGSILVCPLEGSLERAVPWNRSHGGHGERIPLNGLGVPSIGYSRVGALVRFHRLGHLGCPLEGRMDYVPWNIPRSGTPGCGPVKGTI